MTFLSPGMLWWLLAVPVLAGVYVLAQKRRRAYVARFTNLDLLAAVAPKRPGWRRHVAPALVLATLAVLVGALARPTVAVRVPKEQASIVLVIDVSRSMSATDLQPSRMEAAKQAAADFVRAVPEQVRLGIVAFSDTAALVSPLGRDRAETARAIGGLAPHAGTAVGDGLEAALVEIRREREAGEDFPATVLLLSDGASNRGRVASEVAAEAAQMKVPVFTVGVGTEGAVLDLGGRQVPVNLDAAELQGIAEATGGTYYAIGDAGSLRDVYRDLGSELSTEEERREATAVAAGVAAALLLGAAVTSLVWFQRIP